MARRFRFTLDPLLTLRGKVEEECKKAFAAALRAVEEERARAARLDDEHNAARAEIVAMYGRGGLSADAIRSAYQGANQIAAAREQSRLRQVQLDAQLEQARALLIEAQRQRRAVEMLKERRQEEFTAEENRREQAELDETAIRARARRLREPDP